MLIGEVYGKTGPKTFSFRAYKEVKTLDYVTFKGPQDQWILAQIDVVESLPDGKNIAVAKVIGYREKDSLKTLKTPVKPSSLVYTANKETIEKILNLKSDGLYLGRLDANPDVSIYMDLKKLISKHIAILASTGSGKSYLAAIFIEELLDQNVPVVIIDPHGEYVSLKLKNDNEDELKLMEKFNIKPNSYDIVEYSPDTTINTNAKQISFSDKNLSAAEISQIFPVKPTSSQMGVLYAALSSLKGKEYGLDELINHAANTESSARWNVINLLEMVKKTKIFSKDFTKIGDLVKKGQATILNLKGVSPEIQNVVVYKLVEDLFEKRKRGKIYPLFLVIEESQNFAPEKEVKSSSKIIRNVAAEGRKFGLGLCVISQRPARLDKNVLSQCNTQIIMKMTNKNDLKAVSYAESFTTGIEKEIKNLDPGTSLILGQELPLIVNIRVRKSKHGGAAVSPIEQPIEEDKFLSFTSSLKMEDIKKEFGNVKKVYYPCWFILAGKQYLLDAIEGKLIYRDDGQTKELDIKLTDDQLEVLAALDKKMGKDELLKKTELTYTSFISALSSLKKVGYVTESLDGKDVVYLRTKKLEIKDFDISPQPIVIDGDTLKPVLSEEKALKRAKLLVGEINSIKQVYYPYIIGKKFIIDGITGIKKDLK